MADAAQASGEAGILQLPLAELASRLAAPDLLRLRLASKATAAALDRVPQLYAAACAAALGWPRQALTPGGLDTAARAGTSAAAAAAAAEEEAECRELLCAAAALHAAVAPHAVRPQVRPPLPSVAAGLGRSGGFVRRDPLALEPPLRLSEAAQWLCSLGGPGIHVQSCARSPRTRAPCAFAVAVEVGGRVAAELFLSAPPRRRPHPGWQRFARSAPADARLAGWHGLGACSIGGDGGSSSEEAWEEGLVQLEEGVGSADGSGCDQAGPPFELFVSEGVSGCDGGPLASCDGGSGNGRGKRRGGGHEARRSPRFATWGDVRAVLAAAVARNAGRCGAVQRAAVLHPNATPRAVVAAEGALARLVALGYPLLDLRSLLADGPGPGPDAADGGGRGSQDGGACEAERPPRGGECREARRRWRAACTALRERALGAAGGCGGGCGAVGPRFSPGGGGLPRTVATPMASLAQLHSASAALARAVEALPEAAPDARVLVLPLVQPPRGRMGRAQPGRGSAHAYAAPHLLSLMAPVLGHLRAVMPRLPHLQQVLLVCPPTGAGEGPHAGGGPGFACGVARALVSSCLDR
ncbi:hypothetical protein Rsub_11159 [Raphidocelis subcapitata]|uniref:Uncharacterized protein n=1 Tax=Raphidocelis subcapitata TaxID=307507 RepID=A0A2V0PL48_9CHLO|nr:hypothetical protein Rsub_11159 [Raphidocelis subcapitata]|eukprot:GBF98753.1 hypothetical protein Rsub_11159 [Raphidocelis subcapitata]